MSSQPPARSRVAKVSLDDADPAQCPANIMKIVTHTRTGPGHPFSEEHQVGQASVRVLWAGGTRRAAARAMVGVHTERGEHRAVPAPGAARPGREQNVSALCVTLTLCFSLPGVQLCHGELAKERALRHEQRTEPTAHREASQRDR